ncbi:ISSpo9, transposase [Sulfitobacter indolifex HEL-45]|uniref:ISSpo9, transposase n=1 Tax=Sulfitobacter indolifex HEL-45 TaxID=391624 RepID=A0ABM9X0F5_9RHOB|nr:ISSpo9, transposase [Sulfitobacter indolifex HEL-45]
MSSWTPTTDKTRDWAEYNLSLKRRGLLSIWFDPKMAWEATSSGRRGRHQIYSDAAIQACLTLKVLFGLPLRQTTGFVDSLLELVGLDSSVPDFSTLCRRQKTLGIALSLTRDQLGRCSCWWIARAYRLKVSGTLASMEAPNTV